MADDDTILKTIRELQQIPKDVHLFCPEGDPPADTGPEASKATNGEAADVRVNKFFSALQILAYNGDDAAPYQAWIYDKLDEELGNCSFCIRNYYQRQKSWRQELLSEYEAEEVDQFLAIIRRREIARISRGLDSAKRKLEAQPESKREARALDEKMLHALFEALHCEAFFEDETLLQKHFDEPLRLVQTKRALKVTDLLPAVASFLFTDNKLRLDWAKDTWNRLSRSPTDEEWDWAIRDAFKTEIDKVRNDQEFIRYWSALAVIVPRLSPEQTRQKLFDVGINFAKQCLDNLARNTAAVTSIVPVMKKIFTDASDAFFQALVSISATTVAEQIFGSPQFDNSLKIQAAGQDLELDMLSWTTAFIDGLPPANRPAAARTLAYNLHQRMTTKKTSNESANLCCSWLVKVLNSSISTFSNNEQVRAAMDRNVISDALDTVSKYLSVILQHKSNQGSQDSNNDINFLVRNTLALECQCLKDDFDSFQSLSKPSSTTFHTPQIWQTVLDHLRANDHQLSAAIIQGTMALVGLESLRVAPASKHAKEMETFNVIFGKIEQFIGSFVERLTEFPPEHLDPLFMNQDTNMGLMALLFSGNETIYQATVDMIKNLSGVSGRTEALTHLLNAFFGPTLFSICWTFRRISNKRAFAPISRLLKTGRDIMNILCDATGLLRRDITEQKEITPVQSYWSYSWLILGTIFTNMERWSTEVHNKSMMTDVCRDTMQYARDLFSHYYLFLKVLQQGKNPENAPQILLSTDAKSTSGSPPKTLDAMTKWLRLKDEFLAENLVGLITMLLKRLKEYGTVIPEDNPAIAFTMDAAGVADVAKPVKTALTENQKAELVRALEQYLDKRLKKEPVLKKQSRLDSWAGPSDVRSSASTPRSEAVTPDDDFGNGLSDSDGLQKTSRDAIEQSKIQSTTLQKPKPREEQARPSFAKSSIPLISEQERQLQTAQRQKAFIQERKKAEAERKARDKILAARLRGQVSTDQTANAGSGLAGLGVAGKDHSMPRSEMMVSSESESESDSGDEELFGVSMSSSKPARTALTSLKNKAPSVQMPKRVRKVQRSVTDMRARLAPDLTNLHKTILSWDFFSDTDTPPSSDRSDYSLVSNTFRSVEQYQKTFEPLLILEGWQSLRSAREEGQFKPFEIKVASSLIVDNFFEINTSMNIAEGKDLGLAPSDVVLLSKGDRPHAEPTEPHCLARVKEITRKRGEMHVTFRVVSSNPLRPHLHDKSTIYGVSILSLTPLEREFGALSALQYYDLAKEIVQAEPSPLLDYSEKEIKPIQDLYKVNEAQAKAVKSAIDNDAFTLVQGPPGSGKTKTICAIVGALLTESMKRPAGGSSRPPVNGRPLAPATSKKLLVCAPSNAAVDELVMRFKDGITLMDGSSEQVNVVRLGRSEAINAAVKDVTLEELVTARLNNNLPGINGKEDIGSVMMEHKKVSGDMVELRNKMTAMRAEGQAVGLQDEQALDALRRKKLALGSKIDELREKQNSASRDAEINRRRVQQEILDSAHVLCATLSGSGHEMFQNMNVEFETVVIDEAAQSIELSALIPLKYGCLKCILVGDPKQLPPTVLSRQAAKYQYEQSLFARMEKNHKKNVHLLDIQYRMHPEISVFPSRTFYDSKLRDGDDMARLRGRPWHRSEILAPYRFFDVQGSSTAAKAGRSLVNRAEIEVAMQLYERLIEDVPRYDFYGKVGIITPYKGQLKELKQMFTMRYGEQITSAVEFNTTDAFQGRESEVIIFSCVRASTQGIGFLKDVRRMNVGLTRAKCSLWVLGNSQSLIQGEFWKALVTDARSRNLYSDGDILQLLRRPLLDKHMMEQDVVMDDAGALAESADPNLTAVTQNNRGRQSQTGPEKASTESVAKTASRKESAHSRPALDSRRSSNASIPPSRASAEGSRSSSIAPQTRDKESRPNTPLLQGQIPSGGRFGLNTNANCATCGSHAHQTAACDNQEAREHRFGKCSRCDQPGHGQKFCQAPRCLGCGMYGHLEEQCIQPSDTRLDPEARRHVSKQESDFVRIKDRAQQSKVQARQQRDFNSIPTVRSTIPTNHNNPIVTTQGEKRKREHPSPRDDLPKSIPTAGAGAPGFIRPPGSLAGMSHSVPGQQPMIKKKKPREQDMFANKRR